MLVATGQGSFVRSAPVAARSRRVVSVSGWMLWLLTALFVFGPSSASILVIAPHPDDDLITSAGVVYKAVLRGEPVRVVFMTNGDSNGLATGFTRQGEAVNGQVAHLGMSEDHLMFLGYPDGYLDVLYASYTQSGSVFTSPATGKSTTYGNRGLGRKDYHSYRFGSAANYNRPNIVTDLKDIVGSFLPTHILVTSGTDSHLDHSTSYQLLMLALSDVFAAHPTYNPTVHKTNVWTSCGPNPIDPTAYFLIVPCDAGGTWSERESLDVALPLQSTFYPGNNKYQAIGEHVSAGGAGDFLADHVHKDEFFFVEQERGTNRPPVVAAGFDQTVPEGSFVTLDGSGSFDLNGDPLTYQWRQVAGPTVALAGATSAHPTFNAPTGQGQNVTLAFELVVSDGSLGTLPDQVNVTVTSPLQRQLGNNIAGQASVQASSETPDSEAIKVIDGVAEGWPGDSTKEWASNGQGAGAWIRLTWPSPATIGRIVLFDRPNVNDFAMHGVLNFSDGSSVAVGPLDNWGRDSGYDFSTRTVTSVRFDIDQVGPNTSNIGLSEFKVYKVVLPGGNHAPVANAGADQTVNEGAAVTLDGSASHDQDLDPLTYGWTQTGGSTVGLSGSTTAHPTFSAPQGLAANAALTFRLVVNDGALPSPADTVVVTVRARDDDGDGVPNVVDNCPTVANANQLDTVGNGIGDACRCLTVTCAASDQCHVAGVCSPTTGGCSNPAKANGSACNDGSVCTQTDGCQNGSCVGSSPLNCDDNNACTLDSCSAVSGCSHAVVTPPEVARVVVSMTSPSVSRVAWNDSGQGSRYDIIAGPIAALAPDGGAGGSSCVANDVTALFWDDTGPAPAPGGGTYVLIRAQNACGSSGYGSATNSTPRVPGSACP